jgi:protein-S-isoprenylcysteine O-methyltransferase Ste14
VSPGPPAGRGTPWVVAQFALIALAAGTMALGPLGTVIALRVAGALVATTGAALAGWAFLALGRDLTPFTRPREGAKLREHGPFGLVRHPVYGGLLLFFCGLSLAVDLLALAVTALLAAVWAGKAREEEQRLRSRFPSYAAYAQRVRRRFVPFLI